MPTQQEEMREEFRKEFPNLKWETTGGTADITDWWLNKVNLAVAQREKEIVEKLSMLTKYERSKYRANLSEVNEDGTETMLIEKEVLNIVEN